MRHLERNGGPVPNQMCHWTFDQESRQQGEEGPCQMWSAGAGSGAAKCARRCAGPSHRCRTRGNISAASARVKCIGDKKL